MDTIFKIRLHFFKWGATYKFNVYPIGPILQDPMYVEARKSLEHSSTEIVSGSIVKVIDNKVESIEYPLQVDQDDANNLIEVDDFMKIEFTHVADNFLVEKFGRWTEVKSSHTWLPSINAFITKEEFRTLVLVHSHSIKRSITVYNDDNEGVFSIIVDDNVIKVNDRYELHRNGYIAFDSNIKNNIVTGHE